MYFSQRSYFYSYSPLVFAGLVTDIASCPDGCTWCDGSRDDIITMQDSDGAYHTEWLDWPLPLPGEPECPAFHYSGNDTYRVFVVCPD